MNRRPVFRTLLAFAAPAVALAAALALAGCDTDGGVMPSGRALAPLSDKMLADIEAKNMTKELPILVRLYKEESELEVWKQDNTGRFELLKTYPICRWSGELGPKIKLGDRQAPEGFYTITPGQMNPNSNYYLAINTGFPNAYDRANGRTGEFLMIHGDCSSAGCYAMTDEQIAEIYALARESFFGGQKAFQIQAYPFHMTPLNMAKHRNSPHMAFWRMIKEGNDHFEVTHLEPKVDVCDKHYVFDAAAPNGPANSLKFSPVAKCPPYEVPQEIATPVKEKEQRDEVQVAQLISRGTPTVPVRTGTDGGMNPVFMAAVIAHGGTESRIEVAQFAGLHPGQYPAAGRAAGRAPDRQHHEPGFDRVEAGTGAGAALVRPGGFGRTEQPVRRPVLLERRQRPRAAPIRSRASSTGCRSCCTAPIRRPPTPPRPPPRRSRRSPSRRRRPLPRVRSGPSPPLRPSRRPPMRRAGKPQRRGAARRTAAGRDRQQHEPAARRPGHGSGRWFRQPLGRDALSGVGRNRLIAPSASPTTQSIGVTEAAQ